VHTDGTLACWGYGYQLPPAISGTFSSVSVGDAHACAIRSDGAAVCWGDTTFDQSVGCTPKIGCIWVKPT
jgi:alpha-tubulin suppressor-like RCC1 family protein